MNDLACIGSWTANLNSYGAASMHDVSARRSTLHNEDMVDFTSDIESIRNQSQLQSDETPKLVEKSITRRKASSSRHATVELDPEDYHIALIKDADRGHIKQDQLIKELKEIYAGLVMVESKCMEVDNFQSAADEDHHLSDEQWKFCMDVYRALLDEQRGLLLSSQHPSASPAFKRLGAKYAKQFSKSILVRLGHLRNNDSSYLGLVQTMVLQHDLWRVLAHSDCLSEGMEEELEDLLAHIDEVLERIWDRAERWFRGSSLFEKLLDLSFEFAGRMRHLCTTMPWTIWTALVVLWGVCWMFHPPQSVGTINTLFNFLDSQNLFSEASPTASPITDSFFEDKTQHENTQIPSSLKVSSAKALITASIPLRNPPPSASIWPPLSTSFSYVDREPLGSTPPFIWHTDLGGPSGMPHHHSSIVGQARGLLLEFPGENEFGGLTPNSLEDPTTHSPVSELGVSMAMLTDSNGQTHYQDSPSTDLIS
jgi:hypothetical protein